jgi:hypothetical protein
MQGLPCLVCRSTDKNEHPSRQVRTFDGDGRWTSLRSSLDLSQLVGPFGEHPHGEHPDPHLHDVASDRQVVARCYTSRVTVVGVDAGRVTDGRYNAN